MDNCVKVRICENKKHMWLPYESLSLILKFYNHGYGFNLGLKYVGEGIFFAAARDRFELDFEIMYQDKYVRDVLPTIKLQKIKDLFKLSYSDVKHPDYVIVKNNLVTGQQSERSTVGDGATIELKLGKTYPKPSRVYIPRNFAKLLLPAGVDNVWTFIGPSREGNNRFTFKFVRNKSQQNTYLLQGAGGIFALHINPSSRSHAY
ncbi:hypothetical protein PIB30_011404 [Stylosanthes scabra]|uniref:LAGLIDADG homing endonuclease n=1 Tax=Stylosanthes scabra TaxID=79078 RepID=A0ABU6Z6D1_9FABA|nr:hypothetical protein [Stylosanthes scabra]